MLPYLAGSILFQSCEAPSAPRPLCTQSGREKLGQAGVCQVSPEQRTHWVLRWTGHNVARWDQHGTVPPLCLQGSPAAWKSNLRHWQGNFTIYMVVSDGVLALFPRKPRWLQQSAAAGCQCRAAAVSAVRSRAGVMMCPPPQGLQQRNKNNRSYILYLKTVSSKQ